MDTGWIKFFEVVNLVKIMAKHNDFVLGLDYIIIDLGCLFCPETLITSFGSSLKIIILKVLLLLRISICQIIFYKKSYG